MRCWGGAGRGAGRRRRGYGGGVDRVGLNQPQRCNRRLGRHILGAWLGLRAEQARQQPRLCHRAVTQAGCALCQRFTLGVQLRRKAPIGGLSLLLLFGQRFLTGVQCCYPPGQPSLHRLQALRTGAGVSQGRCRFFRALLHGPGLVFYLQGPDLVLPGLLDKGLGLPK